jgi:tetratricopeptide (TPR) repeat protein
LEQKGAFEMRLRLSKVLLLSTAVPAVFICTLALAAEDPAGKIARADDLLNKGKPGLAATILREVIRGNPDNAQAHMELGAALASLVDDDKYDAAIAEEQLALKLDPGSYGARKILGHIYANLHKSQEAITFLKEACEIKPGSYTAQRDLGTACLSAGKINEAISAFDKASKLRPEKVECHLKLSLLLSQKGDFPRAIAEASRAVQLAGDKAETHLALANVKLESGDNAGAIDSFKTAIEKNGFDSFGCRNPLTAAGAYSGLGWAMSAGDAGKNNLEESIRNQRKAIKAYPLYVPAYVRLAELLSRQDKNKEAEAVYQKGLRISGGDAGVAASYARFLEHTGRKDEAQSILRKIVKESSASTQPSEPPGERKE